MIPTYKNGREAKRGDTVACIVNGAVIASGVLLGTVPKAWSLAPSILAVIASPGAPDNCSLHDMKQCLHTDDMLAALETAPCTGDGDYHTFPSAFGIGEHVKVRLDDNCVMYGFIRYVTFTSSKVRYGVWLRKQGTTLHNLDSCFVHPVEPSLRLTIEMPDDNLS